MIRKFRWIALVLAVFMIVSCTSGTPEGRGSVEFRIGGSSGSKTLLPEEIADPDYYSFTLSLRDGSELSSDNSSNKKDVRFETNDEGKYVVDGIKPGTYAVTIEGYVEDSSESGKTKISIGNEDITVKANEQITKSVDMKLISDSSFFGSARITFDWADIKDNETISSAMQGGGLMFILYYMDEDGSWKEHAKSDPSGTAATQLTFTAKDIPASSERIIKYALATSEGIVLNPALFVTAAQIYSGVTSTPSGASNGICYIKASDISEALNVYDVSWTRGDDGKSVIIKWHNQYSTLTNSSLFKTVELYYSASGVEKTKVEVTPSGETSEHTLTEMEPGKDYTISFIAVTKDGIRSSEYTYEEKVSAKILVQSVEVNTDGIPEDLHIGTQFELTATVLPEEATNKGVVWSVKDGSILTVTGNKFTATGIGKTTITATSADDSSKQGTYDITVKLAAPSNVSVSAAEESFEITWDSVTDAKSYVIQRDDGTGSYVQIGTSDTNSYSDTAIYLTKEYTYKVQAVAEDAAYSSAFSKASSPIRMEGSFIEINKPDLINDFEITFKNGSGNYVLLPSAESIKIAVDPIDGVTGYAWMIGDTIVKSYLSAENGGTFVDISRDEAAYSSIKLTLLLKTSNGLFSGSTTFAVISNVPTTVNCDVTGGRVSNYTSYDEETGTLSNPRTISLNASTNGDVTEVVYSSSNEQIASVNPDTGVVTFHDNGVYGEVTITIASAYVPSVKKDITFDVYKPTITSAKQLLGIVNEDLSKAIKNADGNHDSDWLGTSSLTWEETGYNGYTIKQGAHSISSHRGTIEINKVLSDSQISINGKLTTLTEEKGFFAAGTQNLTYVGNTNDILTIKLPYNQGDATIQYNNVNINSESQPNAYTVKFNEVCGLTSNIAANTEYNFNYNESVDLL